MALSIETKGASDKNKAASMAFLNKYLSGALVKMDGMTKADATKAAKAMAEKAADKGISVSDVVAKEKEVKDSLKGYGLREKVNYHSDAKAFNEDINKSIYTMINTAILSSATLCTLAATYSSSPEEGATMGAVMGGVMGAITVERLAKAGLRAVSGAKNEEQAKKVDDYTELKHTQLALKQLKHVLLAPEREAQKAHDKEMVKQLYASGFGSRGGMIAPINWNTKKDGGR